MLTTLRNRALRHKSLPRRMSTTPTPRTRLSSLPHPTAPAMVKLQPIPKIYTKKTFNKKDPATIQLLHECLVRLQDDTKNFKGRELTRVTGTVRKRKSRAIFDLAALIHSFQRHSPRHFGGQLKARNNFFAEDITVGQAVAIAILIFRNGRRMQRRKPKPGQVVDKSFYQMTGRVNGVAYVLGVKGTRVVQLYPKKDSVQLPGPTGELLARLRAGLKPIIVAKQKEEE